jgi:hypothetical protein
MKLKKYISGTGKRVALTDDPTKLPKDDSWKVSPGDVTRGSDEAARFQPA